MKNIITVFEVSNTKHSFADVQNYVYLNGTLIIIKDTGLKVTIENPARVEFQIIE